MFSQWASFEDKAMNIMKSMAMFTLYPFIRKSYSEVFLKNHSQIKDMQWRCTFATTYIIKTGIIYGNIAFESE